MLLIGVLLRAKVSFFATFSHPQLSARRYPGSAIIKCRRHCVVQPNLETFAYHFFNISFISVGLTHNGDNQKLSGPPIR